MATVETEIVEAQQFIGGEWVPSSGGETFDDIDPFTGDVVARIPSGTREDAKKAIEAAAAAAEEWGATPPAVKQQVFLKAAELLESRQRRGRLAARTRVRRHVRFRHVPDAFRSRALPPGSRDRLRADGRDHPVGHRRVRDGHPTAGRRRRRDRALERGADPLRALDHRAARPRQRGRAQALRALAVRGRAALGRDLHRGWSAAGRPEHRHARAGRGRRRSATSWSRTRTCACSTSPARRTRAESSRRPRAATSSAACSSSAATTR